jgi:hypothetical protein
MPDVTLNRALEGLAIFGKTLQRQPFQEIGSLTLDFDEELCPIWKEDNEVAEETGTSLTI